jgi:hypothetical protein
LIPANRKLAQKQEFLLKNADVLEQSQSRPILESFTITPTGNTLGLSNNNVRLKEAQENHALCDCRVRGLTAVRPHPPFVHNEQLPFRDIA